MSITQYYPTKQLISLFFNRNISSLYNNRIKKNIKPLKLIKSARYHISITVFFFALY